MPGMAGRCRQRRVRTTFPGPDDYVIPDLVGRVFTPGAPDVAWCQDIERHEALLNRAVVKGHRLALVAAGVEKLRAAERHATGPELPEVSD